MNGGVSQRAIYIVSSGARVVPAVMPIWRVNGAEAEMVEMFGLQGGWDRLPL